MKIFIRICILFSSILQLSAQSDSGELHYELGLDFGSFRGRYLYPINNVSFVVSKPDRHAFRIGARLRSYGTLFIYSKSAYDLSAYAEYFILNRGKSIALSAGIGVDVRLRFNNDVRGQTENSAEPLMCVAFHWTAADFSILVPSWTRLYLNGISSSLLPEFRYKINEHLFPFVRCEISFLSLYGVASHEWRQDYFIGAGYIF